MDFAILSEIQTDGLRVVDGLLQTVYADQIQEVLFKYQEFFRDLVSYFIPFQGATKEDVYEGLKRYLVQKQIKKLIHFSQYNKLDKPHIFVLKSILLESLQTLLTAIHLFQQTRAMYVEGFKKKWIDSFEPRMISALNDLDEGLPCAEGYVSSLQRFIQELQLGPPEENTETVIVSRIMSPGDFTSDGGFRRAVPAPILKDFQLVGLSIIAFQKALCADLDNCDKPPGGKQPEVQAAFNAHNYEMFLNAIEFYNNPTYGTSMFKTFADVAAAIETYGLSIPTPNEWNPPHCCQKNLQERIQGFEGGRRKRKTRQGKRNPRYRKTKKRALKFSKK